MKADELRAVEFLDERIRKKRRTGKKWLAECADQWMSTTRWRSVTYRRKQKLTWMIIKMVPGTNLNQSIKCDVMLCSHCLAFDTSCGSVGSKRGANLFEVESLFSFCLKYRDIVQEKCNDEPNLQLHDSRDMLGQLDKFTGRIQSKSWISDQNDHVSKWKEKTEKLNK